MWVCCSARVGLAWITPPSGSKGTTFPLKGNIANVAVHCYAGQEHARLVRGAPVPDPFGGGPCTVQGAWEGWGAGQMVSSTSLAHWANVVIVWLGVGAARLKSRCICCCTSKMHCRCPGHTLCYKAISTMLLPVEQPHWDGPPLEPLLVAPQWRSVISCFG